MLKQFHESRLPKPGQHLYIKIPKSPQKRPKTEIINDKKDEYFQHTNGRRSFHSLTNNLHKKSSKNLNDSFNNFSNINNDQKDSNEKLGNDIDMNDPSANHKKSEKNTELASNYGKICTSKSLPKIKKSSYNNNEINKATKFFESTEQTHNNCDAENLRNLLNTNNADEIDSLISCDNIFKNPLILKSAMMDFQQHDFVKERRNSLQTYDDIRLAKDMEYLSTKEIILESDSDETSDKRQKCSEADTKLDSIDDERFSMINSSLFENIRESKNFTEVLIKRPYDVRLENNELAVLFECLNVETMINVFGSLLIERKVILVGESLR